MNQAHRPQRFENDTIVKVLFAILAIATLAPMVGVGITTNDDMTQSSLHVSFRELWNSTNHSAFAEKRFYFYFWIPISSLPYYVHSIRIVHVIGLGTDLLSAYLFSRIIRKFGFRILSYLSFTLFFLGASNTQEHNLFSAYPFVISFGMCAILLGTNLELFGSHPTNARRALTSALFFLGFCTINESALCFFSLPFVLSLFLREPVSAFQWRSIRSYRHLLAPSVAVAFYLIAYVAFRLAGPPSVYDGNKFAIQGVRQVARVVYQYTISAFPGYLPAALNHGITFGPLFLTILWESPAIWLSVFASALLPWFFWTQGELDRLPSRPALAGLALCFFGYAIFPQVLLGLTSKYVAWVTIYNSKVYYTTFFSLLFVVQCLSLALGFVLNRPFRTRHLGALAVNVTLSALFGFLALATGVWNQYISRDQNIMQRRWDEADRFLRSDLIQKIPSGAIFISPTLFAPKALATVPDWYWGRYFEDEIHRPMNVFPSIEAAKQSGLGDASHPWYSISVQNPSVDLGLISVAPLELNERGSPRNLVHSAFVLADSEDKEVGVFFRGPSRSLRTSEVDDEPSEINLVRFRIPTQKWVEVSSQRGFYPESMFSMAADSRFQTLDLSVKYGEGFFGEEHSNRDVWQWSVGRSSLRIINNTDLVQPVRIKFSVSAYAAPRHVDVRFEGRSIGGIEVIPDRATDVEFELQLKSGENLLELESPEPPAHGLETEKRLLTFAIINPRLN